MISIPRHILDDMIAHAEMEAPLEACGLLAGMETGALKSYRLTNVDSSSEHFSLDPKEQFAAVKDARSLGMEIIGVYHSHPASPARMSSEDLRLAFAPGFHYVIVSLLDPRTPDVRSFAVCEGEAGEEPLLTDTEHNMPSNQPIESLSTLHSPLSTSPGTYHIPGAVIEDTLAFRREVEKYRSGETSAVAFRGIRVPMGIYEQRESDTYMVRVRGAAGVFLPDQARAVAQLAERLGSGTVHVTTRQDLQIHDVMIENTPAILEELLGVGLSTRGGGGNTVRNVSACPHAGVCPDEAFDVTPYALALTEYLIRERGNFNLPRKFKAAFSGCARDCALCSVADLGFFAHEREGRRGFSVYAGGGMGAHSALAIPIEEFIPAESIFETAEAVKRLFDRHGDRADRKRARLRFVVERVGPDEFKRLYREELAQVRKEALDYPGVRGSRRAPGLSSVHIPLHLGNISAASLRAIADLAAGTEIGFLRTTQDQDLMLAGVPEPEAQSVHDTLRALDDSFVASRAVRCVACAGASTCKLGLCLSRGLAEAVEAETDGLELPFEATLRISGCPNSCGQHLVAPVGLYGAATRVGGRLVPYYVIVAGGKMAEGAAALGQTVGKVPARAVPSLLRDFFAEAARNHRENESLEALVDRWGADRLRELARKYDRVPGYDEAPEFYRDFGGSEDFSLAGRGPGECGAGVTDVIALDIDEAKKALSENRLYDAVLSASHALLVTRGLEPKTDRETLAAFSEHLIAQGWVFPGASAVLDAALDFRLGDRSTLDDLRGDIGSLVDRVHRLFLSLDSNLDFRLDRIEEPAAASDTASDAPDELDLRGVACPMNFVRAKIHLEQFEPGQVLDILLDQGEPARNVPASFADEGQEILSSAPEGEHFRVKVRKSQ